MDRRGVIKGSLAVVGSSLIPGLLSSCSGPKPSTPTPSPTPTPTKKFNLGLSFATSQMLAGIPVFVGAQGQTSGLVPAPVASTDLSADTWIPPIGTQQSSDCVSWGVGYAAMSALYGFFSPAAPLDLQTTPSLVASPSDLYTKLIALESSQCGNGTYVKDALDILVREGIANQVQVPYAGTSCATASTDQTFILNSYQSIQPTDLVTIKTAVNFRFLCPIAMDVYNDFFSVNSAAVYSVNTSSGLVGGHCVAVVGYDDTKSAFRIMNSWGTGWGDSGFAWISYATFQQIVHEVYCLKWSVETPLQPISGTTLAGTQLPVAGLTRFSLALGSGTYYNAVLGFNFNAPLNVSSVVLQFSAASISQTYSLGQWARGGTFSIPLSASQATALANAAKPLPGVATLQINGVTAAGATEQINAQIPVIVSS